MPHNSALTNAPLMPLKADAFALPDGVIYMDGNSLGPLPKAVMAQLTKTVTEDWGKGLVRSWNEAGWIDLPKKLGAQLAPLLGVPSTQVIASDTVSANIFKIAGGALALRPDRRMILTEKGGFPTDGYMLEGLARLKNQGYHIHYCEPDQILNRLNDDTALVLLTHVHYVRSDIYDMAKITQAAHKKGALILWDLSHSTGSVPLDLLGADVDFAVGCGYKYLNGGPGAPAFLYMHPRHLEIFDNPLSGWMSHKKPFDFAEHYEPARSIEGLLSGTPPILGMVALSAALDLWQGLDMHHIRERSLALSELFLKAFDKRLAPYGFSLLSPRDPLKRGGHLSFAHPHAFAITSALIDQGVIGDFRPPSALRLAFTPLYLGASHIEQALERIEKTMRDKIWQDPRFATRKTVT